MRRFTAIKIFGLFLVMIFITACSAGGATTPESTSEVSPTTDVQLATKTPMPATGTGLCANAYFPVIEGATWNYKSTGSSLGDYSFTSTVSSTRADGFTLTGQFTGLTVNQEWACNPDGLLALQMGGGPAGMLTTQNVKLEMETQNASGVTYPTEIKPGSTWSSSLDFKGKMTIADQPAEATGDQQSSYTAVGVESVTVPAGTFDAMKVQVETTININATYQGVTVPVTFTGTGTSWFVEGMGWVKTDSVSNLADASYSETIELQSYNIP